MVNRKLLKGLMIASVVVIGSVSIYAADIIKEDKIVECKTLKSESVGTIQFEVVHNGSIMDVEMMQTIEEAKGDSDGYVFEKDGQQYIAVFAGEVPTSGYAVQVESITQRDEDIMVHASVIAPPADSMTLQVISYPYTIVQLEAKVDAENVSFSVAHPESAGMVTTTEDYEVGEVITQGEIIQFDGERIHILTGDIVQIYAYDTADDQVLYLGQQVELVKGEGVDAVRPTYTVVDGLMFMQGMPLQSFTGKVVKVEQEELTLKVGEEEVTFKDYGNEGEMLVEGTRLTVYAGDFGEGLSIVTKLNEDTKLTLTVEEITRADNGAMILLATDEAGGAYRFSPSSVAKGFDLGVLQVGDTLEVYHEGIQESYPMGIIATYVDIKLPTQPTDTYKVGQVIAQGEIMEFDRNYIHIMCGDVISIYEYDTSAQNKFYIGQSVELVKGEKNNTLREAETTAVNQDMYIKGTKLVPYTGEVVAQTEDTITLEVSAKKITFQDYSEKRDEHMGMTFTIYAADLGNGPAAIVKNNEETKIEVTVTGITRGYTGEMLIEAVDAKEVPYTFSVSRTMMPFNMMDIVIGDELMVYHDEVEISPYMMLKPTFIAQK